MAPRSNEEWRDEEITPAPRLSIDERDRRWANIRAEMAQRGLDCLVIWGTDFSYGMADSNLRYVTHVPAVPKGLCVFPLDGEPTVFGLSPHLHVPRSPFDSYQDWVVDTRPHLGVQDVVDELRDRDLDTGRIGVVGYGSALGPSIALPYDEYEALQNALPGSEFVRSTDIIARQRMVKSEEEIRLLRKAGTIARAMATDLMDATPGRREAEVYGDMLRTQIESGGEGAKFFNLLSSGTPTSRGPQHLLHGKGGPLSPTQRTLERGDLIVAEYHANYGGYLVAGEKSVALGETPPELRTVHDVCLESLDRGLERFRPGTAFSDLLRAFREPVEEAGLEFIELGVHGHGLASPEFPTSVYPAHPTRTYPDGMSGHPLSGTGISDLRLTGGMVFGINIDVHDPGWRDDVGLMFGDTVLVTSDGPEKLVGMPTDLIV